MRVKAPEGQGELLGHVLFPLEDSPFTMKTLKTGDFITGSKTSHQYPLSGLQFLGCFVLQITHFLDFNTTQYTVPPQAQ